MKQNTHITIEEDILETLKKEVPKGKRSQYIEEILKRKLMGNKYRTIQDIEQRLTELKDKKERELIQKRQAETTLGNIRNRINNIGRNIKDLKNKKQELKAKQKEQEQKELEQKRKELEKTEERLAQAKKEYEQYKEKGYSDDDKLLKNIANTIESDKKKRDKLKKELERA